MTDAPLSTAAAVESLWGGVRIVVIDLGNKVAPLPKDARAVEIELTDGSTLRVGTRSDRVQTMEDKMRSVREKLGK